LRQTDDGVVQQIMSSALNRFFTVAVATDGTVWAGGAVPSLGPTLFRVLPGVTTGSFVRLPFVDPEGRVEDLVLDQHGRLHVVVYSPEANEVLVLDGDVFCRTVDVFDPTYPFRGPQGELSASVRALAAGEGDIWLFGSDGGVARVRDTFREGRCPAKGMTVRYESVFRRQESDLLSNTVPALVVGMDGALWFGTALGLTRWQNGQFTPVPFHRERFLRGDVETLEAFFQQVARAIFEAHPLSTVAIGNVSFVEAFGAPLVKEDLIFSAVEDSQGRLWVGTLGGGLRRIEVSGAVPRETLHLTRQDGLGSNLIFALSVGADGVMWAATDEGVSRIREVDGTVVITNFSALDGLTAPTQVLVSLPIPNVVQLENQFGAVTSRDVAIDAEGTAWVARDAGLFRITPRGGQVQSVVYDTAGHPVMGADVTVFRKVDGFDVPTPFRAVTDAEGRFVVANLPPDRLRLRVDGRLATGGPYTAREMEMEVRVGEQTLDVGPLQRDSDGDGRSDEEEVARGTDPFAPSDDISSFSALAIEADNVFVLGNQALGLVDPGTGDRRLLSGCANGVACTNLIGRGPRFDAAEALAIEADGTLVVVDRSLKAILRVDPGTGDRAFISGCTAFNAQTRQCIGDIIGGGTYFEDPMAIVVESDGALMVVDGESNVARVIRVNPLTGDRMPVSGCPEVEILFTPPFVERHCIGEIIGEGFSLFAPVGIVVEADGTLVVIDGSLNALYRVDPGTGDRTLVSGCEDFACTRLRRGGPRFDRPRAIAVEATGSLMVVDGSFRSRLVRVDPITGDRTIISR
jgi:streptogramin lyase